MPFSKLSNRRKQQIVAKGMAALSVSTGGRIKEVASAIAARFSSKASANNSSTDNLKENIKVFSSKYLGNLKEKARIGATLTKGLTLEEGKSLTGLPISTLAWGRQEIQKGAFFQTNVCFSSSHSSHHSSTSQPSFL